MKKIILLSLVFFQSVGFSQSSQTTEINEQVWKPFIKYYNAHNATEFLALHSKDVIRSPRDNKAIWNWDKYLERQSSGDQRDLKENSQRKLELRFSERISNTDRAIDIGVYKSTYIFYDGKKESYYGRFHVVLRKENEVWKILVDTDSSEGGIIGEKEFMQAKSME